MDAGPTSRESAGTPGTAGTQALSGEELTAMARAAERIEADALIDTFDALPAGFAEEQGFRVEDWDPGYVSMFPSVDEIYFNRVFDLGLAEPVTERLIDDLADRYRGEGVRRFAVQLSPIAQPSQATDWLLARGFRLTDSWAKVYRGTEPPPDIPTSLTIREIAQEHASDFSRVVRSGFPEVPRSFSPWLESLIGRPGWRHYMAFNGNEPVASGSLFVHGDIGWLSFGSTLPSYRRLGAQGR